VNLNGAYNASYDVTLGIPLRNRLKGSSLSFSNMVNYSRDVSRLYARNNFTKNFTISQSAGINMNIEEKVNIGFRGTFSYNMVRYSLQQNQQQNLNTDYFSQNYSVDLSYFILKSLFLSTDFNYALNSGLATGYNQSIPLWNGGVVYQVFKKKNGEIKLSVNDILNQNKSINRTIGENYISDTRTTVVKRYFMLTFTYNLHSFGKGYRGSNFRMRRQIP
jgi:hypothetical protein